MAALLTLALTAGPSWAQGIRAVSLAFDNDGFDFWVPPDRRTDWFYTHGTRLEAVLSWRAPGLDLLGMGTLPPCSGPIADEACSVTRLRLSQEIYTPEALFFYSPELEDRPYAGWLYGRLAAEAVAPERTVEFSVEIGVTGAPSFGQQVHRGFHRWLDKYPPQGWEYQIPFEVGFAASYAERRRFPVATWGQGLAMAMAIQPYWSGTVGTVRTSGEVGSALRIGWHAPPGVEWRGPAPHEVYALLEVGAEGELVLRDLFLDGSLWHHTAGVAKEPALGRARAGLHLGWKSIGLAFDVTSSSREFRGQDRGHVFGTVSLIVRR